MKDAQDPQDQGAVGSAPLDPPTQAQPPAANATQAQPAAEGGTQAQPAHESELHRILHDIEAEVERFLGARAARIKQLIAAARSHL